MEENKQKLNINISPEIAEGKYINMEIITHNQSEFVLDFAQILPGIPGANVKSRVIMTPDHAKRLLAALTDNIEKYEKEFGPINQGQVKVPIGFNIPRGEA
ncbi:MAG: DUF3467 domain-containing protein [Bacteroidales bacterium]|nr:DUF3467 domain-containing protein [Bacteroidales bacterium]